MFRKAEALRVFDKKNIPTFWLRKGVGGQDTPAGVSRPPPRYIMFRLYKHLKLVELLPNVQKSRSFMCSRQKKSHFLARNSGWGPRYPSRGILAPTQIYTVKTMKTS